MDDCDVNADCVNLPGSYLCTCRDGFTGDGSTCTGKPLCTPDITYLTEISMSVCTTSEN